MPASCGLARAASPIVGPEPVDQVDHAVRQPGLLEEAHQVVRGEHCRAGRLPHDRVAHQRRRARQVRRDRREVERRHGEDEALERPVLHAVPDARRRDRLLRVDPGHELDVETEKVDRFAGGVDLRLMRGLRLAEHRGRVQRVAPRAGQQLGRAQQHRGALLPRPARPVGPGGRGRVDRELHVLRAALVHVRENVILVVGHDGLLEVAGGDVLAADHERDLDALAPRSARRAAAGARVPDCRARSR